MTKHNKQMKNILVTGGAGFIGSQFVADMVLLGHNVIVLDALTYAGDKKNLEYIESPAKSGGKWQLVEGDICDGKLVLSLLRQQQIDWLVNFAAESHVDNSIAAPAQFIETNIIGCYKVLEAVREYLSALADGSKADDFRMVHVSTDEIYGSLGAEGRFSESTAIKPNSPYSASKAAGDCLCRAWYQTYALPVITTNCSNNYGARQHDEKLIPKMISNALSGEKLTIYGDGQAVRDWIYVEDHTNGIYLALTKGDAGETYCFGGNAERKNIEVVTKICDILDELKPAQNGEPYRDLICYTADRAGHDLRYAIDDSKAVGALGFARKYGFDDGLRATVKWYLDNGLGEIT